MPFEDQAALGLVELILRPMVTPAHMALNCPVPHCQSQFKTKRTKNCLHLHLMDSNDRYHEGICTAKYPAANAKFITRSICPQTFEMKSKLKRHNWETRQ